MNCYNLSENRIPPRSQQTPAAGTQGTWRYMWLCLFIFVVSVGHHPQAEATIWTKQLDIPFTKYTLTNGLRLIVHEDHKAPIVSVQVYYHVGSKNEQSGRTGFAHLFEHIMFNGSENYRGDYFKPLEKVGATAMNGTTSNDITRYFQNVPKHALPLVLWMESDRMGHLLGALSQEVLNEQRGVVKNEKRQYENEPYGQVFEIIGRETYPAGHPYSWPVIGSMEDLDAATLEDVKNWFKTYYGAANVVIVIAGDIKAEEAYREVNRFFGHIPSGPPLEKPKASMAQWTQNRQSIVYDRVPFPRLYKVWNIPPIGDPDVDHLDLVSDILGLDKTSPLYRSLVVDRKLASEVNAYIMPRELGSQFVIQVTTKPDVPLHVVDEAVETILKQFIEKGVNRRELQTRKTQLFARFLRSLEPVGGFSGKAGILATHELFFADPGHFKVSLQTIDRVSAKTLTSTAKRWLSHGSFTLQVLPFPEYSTLSSSVDRSRLPDLTKKPTVVTPTFDNLELANGMKVVFARRGNLPIIEMAAVINAGYAHDVETLPGTCRLTFELLDEGTNKRSSVQISQSLAALGADISISSGLDTSTVALSVPKDHLDQALEVFSDIIFNANFPDHEFDRHKLLLLEAIEKEKSRPAQLASRILPKFIYGEKHPYGLPSSGSGLQTTVTNISRQSVVDAYHKWFTPTNITLVVVGDMSRQQLLKSLNRRFAEKRSNDVKTALNIEPLAPVDSHRLLLIDRPGSIQSFIIGAHLIEPRNVDTDAPLAVMNEIVGGGFTSRINMNIREDKHWSYGARSFVQSTKGPRMFAIQTSVQSDKTTHAIAEILKELDWIASQKPITADELEHTSNDLSLGLIGRWETNRSVLNSLASLVSHGLPDNYFDTYLNSMTNLSLSQLDRITKETLANQKLTWLVIGDAAKISDNLKQLNIAPLQLINEIY